MSRTQLPHTLDEHVDSSMHQATAIPNLLQAYLSVLPPLTGVVAQEQVGERDALAAASAPINSEMANARRDPFASMR